MRHLFHRFLCGAMTLLTFAAAAQAQWSGAQLLNEAAEAGGDCKDGKLVASKNGGFHAVYTRPGSQTKYRRCTTSLQPSVVLGSGTFFNPNVAEAGSGDVHVVVENWNGSPAPQVGWAKSANGGTSFSALTNITNTAGCAKHPQIAPFGTAAAADIVMTYYRTGSCDRYIDFRRYDGSSWLAEASIGSKAYSEYDCFGTARSPLDGSVWRSFDPNGTTMKMRRFDGAWGAEVGLVSGTWAVRQHMAINAAGQVMVVFDDTSRVKSVLYTPGTGAGPIVDLGAAGYSGACDVCWLPGTNEFYMVVVREIGTDRFRLYGRRWTAGAWQAEESIATGLADAFALAPSLAASPSGTLYCSFEYWGNGRAQQWYTSRTPFTVPAPGAIAGVVTDHCNIPIAGATVSTNEGGHTTTTAADGSYTLANVAAGFSSVTASKPGFAGYTQAAVWVNPAATTSVNLGMATANAAVVAGVSVSNPTLIADDATVYTVTERATHATGVTFIRDMRVMFNLNIPTPATARGYFAWGMTPGDVTKFGGTVAVQGAASGGGYWGFDVAAWGYQYVVPLGCSTSTSGGERTVTWSFRVKPAWVFAGPRTGNFIGVWVRDCDTHNNWQYSNTLFGYTFNIDPQFCAADLDHDGDVDGGDFGVFASCFNGTGMAIKPDCAVSDLNADHAVDGIDYGLFASCFNGSGNVPACR